MANFFATLWMVTHQSLLSLGFPRQESWSRLTFPSPGHLSDPGMEWNPRILQLAGRFFTTEPPGKPSIRPESLPTTLFHLHDTLEKTKQQRQKIDQGLPRDECGDSFPQRGHTWKIFLE